MNAEDNIKNKRTIIITGSNRGLGYGLIEDLCEKYGEEYRIIMTSRDKIKGEEALKTIKSKYINQDIIHIELDVQSQESQNNLYSYLKENNFTIDVLVNNAGIIPQEEYDAPPEYRPTEQVAKNVILTNLYAPIQLTNLLIPLLTPSCKIIHIGSRAGLISEQPKSTQLLFDDNIKLTQDDIFTYAQEFIHECSLSLEEKSNDQTKWLMKTYETSKFLLNAYVRYVGQSILKQDQNMFVLTPGWVRTDMGGPKAARSIQEGNDTALFLITQIPYERNQSLNCKFIADRGIIDW